MFHVEHLAKAHYKIVKHIPLARLQGGRGPSRGVVGGGAPT